MVVLVRARAIILRAHSNWVSMAWYVIYSDVRDEVVHQCRGLSEPGDSLTAIGSRSHIVHPLMGLVPLVPGVAPLSVPGPSLWSRVRRLLRMWRVTLLQKPFLT